MAVITVSREIGSQGTTIACTAAKALDYHVADQHTIEDVFRQYGFLDFQEVYNSAPGLWARFDQSRQTAVDLLNRVISAIAQHGNVIIVGRGSYALFRGFADVLNVRIQAPLPVRVRRVMEERNIADMSQAEALVKEHDKARISFVESAYGVRWDSASAFDLVIDTSKVAPELASNWIVKATTAIVQRPASEGEGFYARALQVDPVLTGVISSVLGGQAAQA